VLASKARCSLLFLFAFYVIIGPRIGFVSDPFISVLQV
jgi:hypothetical protein